MVARCSLAKCSLSEIFLLVLAGHLVVKKKNAPVCCYADTQSECSILRDMSLFVFPDLCRFTNGS